MLSHAKYPYLNRFYRRHPECYAGYRWPLAKGTRAYPLLLALLARLGSQPRVSGNWYDPGPCPAVPIKSRWQRIKDACSNAWQWVKDKVGC